MSEIDAEYEKYKKDARAPCRYGDKCYQRNSAHLSKYKHPPKKGKRKNNEKPGASKRLKVEETPESQKDRQITSKDESPTEKTEVAAKKESISSSDSDSESSDNNSCNEKITNKKIDVMSTNNKAEQPKTEVVKRKECISSSGSDSENNDSNSCKEEETTDNTKNDKVTLTENKDEIEQPLVSDNESAEQEVKTSANRPFDPRKFIKSRFLLELPNDFYDLWEFCKELNSSHPSEALKEVGLKLVGPYDVLAGKFKHVKKSTEDYLCHWRYYYDPPEVLTVIKGNENTGYHIGYFYDSPDEAPPFLVSNYGMKDGVFTKLGDNIFAALCFYLEELKKIGDPFKKMNVGKVLMAVKARAEKLKLNTSSHSQKIKDREKKVVAKTYNKIGLVVPYNKKTQLGYRDLAMQDKELMTLLSRLQKASSEQKAKYLSDLQPVLTYANIALDECDFGTGVKLGWELLYHGIDSLNATISQFLSNSYRLLNKEAFAKIAEAHMNNRKKGPDLSIM